MRGRRFRPWAVTAGVACALVLQSIAVLPGVSKAASLAGTPGTPGYQKSQAHAGQSPADTTTAGGVLTPLYSSVLHGGYVSAGVGLRDLGHGRITITSIPSGSTVVAAFLLWDVLDNTDRADDARGELNGTPFIGTMIGTGLAPCWPANNNYAFDADVTKLVAHGNGGYTLTGMPSSLTDGEDPWSAGAVPPMAEGASLVVVYKNASSPLTYVGLSVGGTETPDNEYVLTANFSGFDAASSTSADKTTFIVADGQSAADGPATFNGTDLVPGDFQGLDPQAVPPYSNGDLWDTSTYNVGSLIAPGSTTANATMTGTDDCLVWVGQALSITAASGGSGKVIVSFGDSVSAGEGGPSPAGPGVAYTGYPDDSTTAYPAVLAAGLGATDYNFSQSGACASNGVATNTKLPNCQNTIGRTGRPNTVEDELSQARPYSLHPNLITLTVGADDLNFAECIKDTIGFPSSGSTCADSSADLSDITANATNVLKEINAQYPGVPVLLTRYYFPLPTSFPVNNSNSVCGSAKALYLASLISQGQYGAAADELVTDFNDSAADKYLNGIVSAGQAVAGKLDGALTAAASAAKQAGVNVTTAQLTDTGHDLCQDYAGGTGWVLGPSLYVYGSVSYGIFSASKTIQYTPSDTCAVWKKGICGGAAINKSGTWNGINYSLTAIYDINDLPHPTVAGQAAFAKQLSGAAATLLGSSSADPVRLTADVWPRSARPADDTPGSVSGTVTDAADPGGLSGVCVLATSSDGGSGFGGTTTASDGTYEIGNLPPDSYTVEFDPTCGATVTSADAPQQYASTVTVASGGAVTGINAELAAAGSISGTVTDAADPGGLPGVCVTAISADGGIGFASATTAADGTYTLSGLSADSYSVDFDPTCNDLDSTADLPQSTAAPVTVAAGASVTGINAALTSGGAISGTVTDAADPGGLAGVCVTATSSDGGTSSGTATTASDGTYEIDDLPPGSYTVEFDPTCGGSIDSVDAPRSTATPVTVTAGNTSAGVNAVLAEYGSVTGTVTDPADPGGVSGVCVDAYATAGGATGSATTTSGGGYSIGQLPPGSYTVEFDPSCGGTVSTLDLFQETTSPVTVTAAGSTTVNAALNANGAIEGIVTDAANPSGLAGVCVSAASADGGAGSGIAVTAADGTYSIGGLPADTYTVAFDPTCGATRHSADVPQVSAPAAVTAGSATEVNAQLTSGGTITGKVTDKTHPSGLPGVCVTAASSDGGTGFGTATTGSGGGYQIAGLPADSYRVIFDPTCGGKKSATDIQQATAKPVTVTAGATVPGVNASLVAAIGVRITADGPAKQAVLNANFSYTFKATGNPAPIFTVDSGQLPTGLTLNTASGVLSGKPAKKGTFTFQIEVSNGYGKPAATPKLTITVAAAAHPKFTKASPSAAAKVGKAYSYQFTASGFPTPRFTVSSGKLPPGLSLNSVTGVLSGKPTKAGTFTFTIAAANGVSPAAKTPVLRIVVQQA